MTDEEKAKLEAEKQANGGEPVVPKTPEPGDDKDYQKIAEDQRKRAEKAEAEAKEAKVKAKEAQDKLKEKGDSNLPINAPPSPEEFAKEVRLMAPLSDEEIAEAKDIAKGKGITLEEALKTKTFKAFQKELKDEERKEKAKLAGSKGSGQEEEKNDFDTPATPEGNKAHFEAWKKATGR